MGILDDLLQSKSTDGNGNPVDLGSVMQSPLFQMGLGILSGNKGPYALQNAIGGGVQGLQNAQQYQQQAQENSIRNQQFDLQKQHIQMQLDAEKRKQAEDDAFKSAISGAFKPAGTNPNWSFADASQAAVNGVPYNQQQEIPASFDIKSALPALMGKAPTQGLSLYQSLQKANDPIKLGKDDRLIDPTTHSEIVGASSSGGDDTTDIKGFRFAKSPEGGGFKGTFQQYLQIKPELMAQVAAGQLAVAQGNLGNNTAKTDYEIAPKPKSSGYSVNVGGKTYTFKDQKSLNNFKLSAGIR